MRIDIGYISDDNRRIDKVFVPLKQGVEANIYGKIDLLGPVLKVAYDGALLEANYCYVPAFHRFYYIDNISGEAGEILYLACRVDVLKSYQDEILNLMVEVGRSSATQCKFLNDGQMPIKTDLQVQNYEFSTTPFQTVDVVSGNYLLTVLGGMEWGGVQYEWVRFQSQPADWNARKFQYAVRVGDDFMMIGEAIKRGLLGNQTDPTFSEIEIGFGSIWDYRPVSQG